MGLRFNFIADPIVSVIIASCNVYMHALIVNIYNEVIRRLQSLSSITPIKNPF